MSPMLYQEDFKVVKGRKEIAYEKGKTGNGCVRRYEFQVHI
jgi:hypothetical protein